MGLIPEMLESLGRFYPHEDGYMKMRATKMPGAWFALPFVMPICGRNA
jgi:hypothetical protein